MSELAKINHFLAEFKREIAIIETIEEAKQLSTKAEIMAQMAIKLKVPLDGQNELGRTRNELEIKKRELIEVMFPKKGTGSNQYKKVENSENTSLADYGITWDELGRLRMELEKKKRELIEVMFPHGGKRKARSTNTILKDFGITLDESSNAKICIFRK